MHEIAPPTNVGSNDGLGPALLLRAALCAEDVAALTAWHAALMAAERERCAQQFVENGREIGRQEERERWVLHCTAIGDMASTGGDTVPEVMAALARISAMAYMGPNG